MLYLVASIFFAFASATDSVCACEGVLAGCGDEQSSCFVGNDPMAGGRNKCVPGACSSPRKCLCTGSVFGSDDERFCGPFFYRGNVPVCRPQSPPQEVAMARKAPQLQTSFNQLSNLQVPQQVQSAATQIKEKMVPVSKVSEVFNKLLNEIKSLENTKAVLQSQSETLKKVINIETQIINHQAANGRIMDVDVARESSNLAKQQVLVQSAASMTAQANLINDVALMLIRGN
jgi:hypothetical protein